ncbi:MAG TPA: HAMP domain-containing sensor histidine kinase [Polyangiaceae bacterium]|nr:HAMP domain-containing sensor histidine kinase [Polyangiaceae bacterium]
MRRRRERRLHQQLFAWLALTIVASVAVSALVLNLLEPARSPFNRAVDQAASFAARQFAERWDDAAARDRLARDVADTFGVQLILVDASERPLLRAGPEPCHGPTYSLDVDREGQPLGRIDACVDGAHRFRPLLGLALLCSVCLVLWTAAALLARRITRPLSLLIGTTREIGSGNLSARVQLGRHQRGELRLLAESVNDMAQRIERQMRDQRELLAAVSHEVRSPLARLRLSAEILRNDPGNAPALDSIELEVVELDGLVGQLLASSRLDFETSSKQEVVVADLFRQILARRQLDAGLLDDRSGGSAARVDATLITRALDNMLDNAVRHAGKVSRCSVRVAPDAAPTEIVFEVLDAGPGFPADVLPKVFEAFYRGPDAPQAAPGSLGLGLALVRRIARAHGGNAWAENLAQGGARVAFSVALHRA